MSQDPIEAAVDQLFAQFSILADVGYTGGMLAGDRGVYRLTVPLTGRIMEGITVVSNLPSLPYGASPTRVAQDAIFKWLYVLTAQLAKADSPALALLNRSYNWELRLTQAAEEGRQLQLFRAYLSQKAMEIEEGGHVLAILAELRVAADAEAPTESLRQKCSQAVAENHVVRANLNLLPADTAEPFVGWLEPYVT